jgi:hypothetical protein
MASESVQTLYCYGCTSLLSLGNLTSLPLENRTGLQDRKIPPHFAKIFAHADDKTCSICTEEIQFDLTVTPCLHFFHSECLREAKSYKTECPNCRQDL